MNLKIKKQLTTLIGFNVICSFSDSFFYLVLLSFVTQESHLRNLIPLVSMSETFPYFFSIIIGTLADRTKNKRKSLLRSSVIRIVTYFVILLFYLKTNIFLFIIVTCCLNIVSDICGKYASSLQIPLIKLLIQDETKMEQLQGINSAVGQISTIAGTLVGGILFTKLSLGSLLMINIFMFFLSLVMTICIIHQCKKIYEQIEVERKKINNNFIVEVKSTIRIIFRIPNLKSELILISIMNILLSVTLVVVSMMFSGKNISGQLSIIQTLQILFMVFGSVLSGIAFKKISLLYLLPFFFLSYFTFLISLLLNTFWLALISIALFSLILGVVTPKFMASIILNVDEKNIGGFVGIVNTLIMLGPFLNTILLQILSPVLGIITIIYLYILVTIAAATCVIIKNRQCH